MAPKLFIYQAVDMMDILVQFLQQEHLSIIINEINLDNHDLSDGMKLLFDISHSSGQEVCVGSMVFKVTIILYS